MYMYLLYINVYVDFATGAAFEPLFKKFNVDIFFYGHIHGYEVTRHFVEIRIIGRHSTNVCAWLVPYC